MNCQQQYKGHPVFHNQPATSYYDKSFDDPTDTLYLQLNEIDPYFLNEGHLTHEEFFASECNEDDNLIKDPRTKQEVDTYEYDHSEEKCSIDMFTYPFGSSLNAKQHAAGIRVLQAWQQSIEVNEDDFQIWCKMARFVQNERKRVANFIQAHELKHKSEIYAPAQRLVKLYQQWYASQLQKHLTCFAVNASYNTTVGLPHVRLCKPLLDERKGKIGNIRTLAREGLVRVHEPWHINYKVLNIKLEAYAQKYIEVDENKNVYIAEDKISDTWQNLHTDLEDNKAPYNEGQSVLKHCFIPLETILFLLLAGEFVDLPTEVMLRIDTDEDGYKNVHFQEPLPARNCGWHTHNKVVQHAYDAQLFLDSKMQWLHLECDKVSIHRQCVQEIRATPNQHKDASNTFKAYKFEEYLNKFNKQLETQKRLSQHCAKTNEALIAWQLQTYAEDDNTKVPLGVLQMLTALNLPVATSTTGQHFYASNNIKLEYKASMGCEVLTKYELLKHWWQLRLLETDDTRQESTQGLCTRLCCKSFELLLVERLTRGQIEQQLFEQFQIRMPNLLIKLYEFLSILGKSPNGEYLLRHNFKYTDKLLLCAPSKEITVNTIHMHKLLQTTPSDLCFMTIDALNLPLAEHLCSRVHIAANVMPCTFPPLKETHKRGTLQLRKKSVFYNDREQILKRVATTQKIIQTKAEAHDKKRRKVKKARNRKVKRALKKRENEEQAEYENDLQNDEILFGNN